MSTPCETGDCKSLQDYKQFRPGYANPESVKSYVNYLKNFLFGSNSKSKSKPFKWMKEISNTSNKYFILIFFITFLCAIGYSTFKFAKTNADAIDETFNGLYKLPILITIFSIYIIYGFYFWDFYSFFGKTSNGKDPASMYTVVKQWTIGRAEGYRGDVLKKIVDKNNLELANPIDTTVGGLFWSLYSHNLLCLSLTIWNIIICGICGYIFYYFQATILYFTLLCFALWALLSNATYLYTFTDRFAKFTDENAENKASYIFSNFNFWVIFINSLVLLLTFLFYLCKIGISWQEGFYDFALVFGIVAISMMSAPGDSFGEKYEKIMSLNKSYFAWLTPLTFYVLFMMSYLPSPSVPAFLQKFYENNKDDSVKSRLLNFYNYVFFPILLTTSLFLFYKSITFDIDMELDAVDYNYVRMRFVIIYLLLLTFLYSIFKYSDKLPCYIQKFFKLDDLNYIVGALMSAGFLFVLGVTLSPTNVMLKTPAPAEAPAAGLPATATATATTKTTATATTPAGTTTKNLKDIFTPLNTWAWFRITAVFSLIGIQILFRYLIGESNTQVSEKKFTVYECLLAVVAILIGIVEFFNYHASYHNEDDNWSTLLSTGLMFIGGIAFFSAITYGLYMLFIQDNIKSAPYIFYILVFLCMYFVFKILLSISAIQNNTTVKLLVEFVFLLPCFFEEYILQKVLGQKLYEKYLTINFNNYYVYSTVIVIFLLILYFLPSLTSSKTSTKTNTNVYEFGGTVLCQDPVELNTKTSGSLSPYAALMSELITDYPEILREQPQQDVSLNYLYNYCITFWVYFENTQDSNGTVLYFANTPLVTYDGNNEMMEITFSDDKNQAINIQAKIKSQIWNYVAINVNAGFVDVFINNNLEKSIENFVPNFLPNSSIDSSIYIGNDNNNINGKFCNFVYYPKALTIITMNKIYNTYKGMDPPVYGTYYREVKKSINSEASAYNKSFQALDTKYQNLRAEYLCKETNPFKGAKEEAKQPDPKDSLVYQTHNLLSLKWVFQHMGDEGNGLS
jgi:hypothetical protein